MHKMFKTDLFNAVESRNLKKVKSVLKKRPDGIHKTKNGDSPLHFATSLGFTDIMEILIQNGSNVNKKNTSTGVTPLHIACGNAHYDGVLVLREHDADPSLQCSDGNTPFHEAARAGNIRILKFLFNYDFDINITNNDGWTALHRAVFSNREDAVQVLCQEGINVSIKNNAEKTAYDVAVQFMYYNLAEIIRNFERKPDHPKTILQSSEAVTGSDTPASKIDNLFEPWKESFKTLFTWKKSHEEKDATSSVAGPDTNSTTDEREGTDSTNSNSKMIPFFAKISNLTSQIKSPKLAKQEIVVVEIEGSESKTILKSQQQTETEKSGESSESNVNTEEEDNQEPDEDTKPNDDEMHECPVCFEIPLPPTHIYQCRNGHLYCGNCKEMPNMFNCPQCNVDIATSSSRNRYAEENIVRLYKNEKRK